MITTISSRNFNQDLSGAKRAATQGPVIITDRGKAAHVLMTIEAYHCLTGSSMSLADVFSACPEDTTDFQAPKLDGEITPADFT